MKKIRFISILILFSFCAFCFPLFTKADVFAAENTETGKISTGIFLPTSYLQYYKLDNPFAICRYVDENEEFVAISHNDAIVVYKNEKFATIPLELDDTSVTVLERYKNYLLFLYDSTIHTIDITDFENDGWTAIPKDTGIISNTSFSICGDMLVRHTNDYIYKHNIITDLSGDFAVDEGVRIDEKRTAMLNLSPNGSVYFSKIDYDGIFEWDGKTSSVLYEGAKNVSAMTCSDNGNTLYYSCPEGVFSINLKNDQRTTVRQSSPYGEDSDLGNLYSPQGICLLNENLWIVDNKINAVQEIDLKSGEFTQFAITTNSNAVNRLTSNARDIVIDKDTIYALDEGRIVVINNANSENRTYNRINLTAPVDKFSAGDGYICYSNGKTVNLCKISPSYEDENIFELTENLSSSLTNSGDVVDIAFSEGIFYVISTTILKDNLSHPVIYKVDVREKNPVLEPILSDGTEEGAAVAVVADVFGTVYYCTENKYGFYEFYSYDGNSLKFIATHAKDTTIKNLQTDFDGKLFALYGDNLVRCIEDGNITEKTLQTSENLGKITPAKSMCLSCDSEVAYFIFDGLILSSSTPTDLNVATPHTITIPEDFSLEFDKNQQFANVKKGAKLFEVDLSDVTGDYFKFLTYSEATETEDYAVKTLNDKYSLLINENLVAVARTSDILTPYTYQIENAIKYAVVEFSTYSVPVMKDLFKSENKAVRFNEITIDGKISFNGTEFFVVEYEGNKGFVPVTFLVESVMSQEEKRTISDAYIYDKNGVIVYDKEKDGKQIGVITEKTKVTVYKFGDMLAIEYKDGIGYVSSEAMISDSRSDILKSVALFLAALSICATAIFFEERFLVRK